MAQSIELKCAGHVVLDLIDTVNQNRAYLSEIDGAIGDGDHGINMSKGFSQCRDRLSATPELPGLAEAFDVLAMTLLEGIGGSMGPLYGSVFMGFSETLTGHDTMDATLFGQALEAAVTGVQSVGDAKVGDKTLMDTLIPAHDAYLASLASGANFSAALSTMTDAAETGWKSTKDLKARIGRSARLGERSIGVLDAGATSCFLLLKTMAISLQKKLG